MNTEFPDLHSSTGFLKENRPSDTSCKVKNFSPPPFPLEAQSPSLNPQSIESIAVFKKRPMLLLTTMRLYACPARWQSTMKKQPSRNALQWAKWNMLDRTRDEKVNADGIRFRQTTYMSDNPVRPVKAVR